MKTLFCALPLLFVAGCASTPVAAPPKIVTITKIQYVSLPAADLVPCVISPEPMLTGADVIAAWLATRQALAVCDGQIDNLRHLNNQKVKP